jgi:hypothetical protein
MEALAPFTVDNYKQDLTPLPYLQHSDPYNFDINLQVDIKREPFLLSVASIVSQSNTYICVDERHFWSFIHYDRYSQSHPSQCL